MCKDSAVCWQRHDYQNGRGDLEVGWQVAAGSLQGVSETNCSRCHVPSGTDGGFSAPQRPMGLTMKQRRNVPVRVRCLAEHIQETDTFDDWICG